jgi:hypothetical protein
MLHLKSEALSLQENGPPEALHRLRLRGRYMLPDRSEHECETCAVAAEWIDFAAPGGADVGDRVIAYIDELGRIEGVVAAATTGGFAIAVTASLGKRERLTRKIAWLYDRQEGRAAEARKHQRIEPETEARIDIVFEGQSDEAAVVDCSQSGVALYTELPLKPGDKLAIGGLTAKVVRIRNGVLAAEFDKLQPGFVAKLRRAG